MSSAPPGTYVLEGRHEAVVANTNAEIGGVASATVLLDAFAPGGTATYRAAVAIREAFHAWQRANHPDWAGNVAVLFTYPTESVELLALRRLETRALGKALAADAAMDLACWARLALFQGVRRVTLTGLAKAARERGRRSRFRCNAARHTRVRTCGGGAGR